MPFKSRIVIPGVLLIALVFFCWRHFGTDPQSAFLSEIDGMITQINEREHLSMRKRLSPEAEEYISNNFMTVPQALFSARKQDTDRNIRYRRATLDVFYAGDYAEIEIERSGPGGDFSNARRFPVPFVYRNGKWLVAGGFRGERDFSNPFD